MKVDIQYYSGHRILKLHFGTRYSQFKWAVILDVGIDWLMRGNKDRKNYPADQKMIDWLWEHPDVREMIWNMMKNEE